MAPKNRNGGGPWGPGPSGGPHQPPDLEQLLKRGQDKCASASATDPATARTARQRGRKYDAIKDAVIALWEASDRVCGKRLVVMIPTLLPALERHGRLRLGEIERTLVLSVSAATIDRLLGDVKVAAAGGRR